MDFILHADQLLRIVLFSALATCGRGPDLSERMEFVKLMSKHVHFFYKLILECQSIEWVRQITTYNPISSTMSYWQLRTGLLSGREVNLYLLTTL